MNKSNVVILGAGGHARVVIDCLLSQGDAVPMAILTPEESLWEETLFDIPIVGGDDLLESLVQEGATHFVVGVGSVGDPSLRIHLFDLGLTNGLLPLTVVHPTAYCSPRAQVEEGAQLLPACVINAGAQIGKNVIVNSGAIVEHDCQIGAHAHIATGAHLSGGVIVEEGAHVGAGATVLQGRRIGRRAIVGAGALVNKDVKTNSTVVGNPARPLN